jgi:hypothetical protein
MTVLGIIGYVFLISGALVALGGLLLMAIQLFKMNETGQGIFLVIALLVFIGLILISTIRTHAATIPPVSRIPAMRAYIPTLNKVYPCDQINVHNGVSKCYFYRTDLVKGKNVTKLIYAGKGILEMSTGKVDIHSTEIWQDDHIRTPGFEDGVVMFGNEGDYIGFYVQSLTTNKKWYFSDIETNKGAVQSEIIK